MSKKSGWWKLKKYVIQVILLISALLLLVSCESEAPKTQQEKPIQIALTQDMRSFDPILTSDIYSEAVLRCVYTSLYDFDENMQLRPKLVKESKVIDDCTWLIEIHDGVKFHDGSTLTAADVVFSIERALTGERTQKLLEMVERVEQVDNTHFYLVSKQPYSELLTLFAKAETSIVSKAVVEAEGYDFTQPVGTGPFRLLSRKENELIQLERFDDCFLGPAVSQFLNFAVLVTEQERTAAFLNGNVDVLFSVSAYDCNKIKLTPGVQLFTRPSTKIEYLSLNNTHPPLDDPRVRLAINYAIDRESITTHVYHGYSVAASSLIPEGVMGFLPDQISYDPEKARTLLKEAGMEDGFAFTVIAIDTIRKNTMEYIKLDLAKVGITLNYDLVTMQEAVERMNANTHDGILVGWAFNSDPNSVLPLIIGTGSGKTMNSSNYSNPEVDALLAECRAEPDADRRRQQYEEVNATVVRDSPIIVLQNPMVLCAAHENISGVTLNPQGLIQYESLGRKPQDEG